jgi:hypothetical protein
VSERGCPGHANLAEELRSYAEGALDLLEPWVDRIREQPGDEPVAAPAACVACPVCAVITVLCGGHSELAARLAEHTAGLLAVLRAALEEGIGAPTTGQASARPASARPQPPTPQTTSQQPTSQQPTSQQPTSQQPTSQPTTTQPPTAGQPHTGTGPPRAHPWTAQPHQPLPWPTSPQSSAPAHSPARHRPAVRGSGRGGRVVQHIEITRESRGRPSPEPSPETC